MRRTLLGLFLVALATLVLEVLLTRVFDVILRPELSYLVIMCVMFALGLGGIWEVLRPLSSETSLDENLARLAASFGVSVSLLLPALNVVPFDFDAIPSAPVRQMASFAVLYLALVLPFFFAGLLLARIFSRFASEIGRVYFFDLAGAALGSLAVIPLLGPLGPGPILLLAAAATLVASALFSRSARWRTGSALAAGCVAVFALVAGPDTLEIRYHHDKRGVRTAIDAGRREYQRWDPISKIDVLDERELDRKHIAYDGGNQSSFFYRFDGDLEALRGRYARELTRHFWHRGAVMSHYLKRDTGHRVLVIGSAGGQETKAALMYGASRVDAVEMVGTVVELGRTRYSDQIGGIFLDPRVQAHTGDGRSFLRRAPGPYDVIQIFSNHTSSSLASGSGAVSSSYLQTVEAYREYFSKLSADGILHVNHHVYPRIVTTAARAWKDSGHTDFRRHVVVVERRIDGDHLPTVLIRNSEWTPADMEDLERVVGMETDEKAPFAIVEHPLDPAKRFLSDEFFSGEYPESLSRIVPFRCDPPTDDRPFFSFLRRSLRRIETDPERFTNEATASLINRQTRKYFIAMDLLHVAAVAVVSMCYACLFVLVPLLASPVGRAPWPGKSSSLVYFGCLGAGFIMVELVSIQILTRLIGYPLYTVALVIFTMLLAAALGALSSRRVVGASSERWWLPFAGILLLGAAFRFASGPVIAAFMASPTEIRLAAGAVLVFPLGFFMGMPFPRGVAALAGRPRGAIAWAWGMNGLTTVIGGLASVVLALAFGFETTFGVALFVYAVAFAAFAVLRSGDRREGADSRGGADAPREGH